MVDENKNTLKEKNDDLLASTPCKGGEKRNAANEQGKCTVFKNLTVFLR